MDALTLSAACILCATQPTPTVASVAQWHSIVAEASTRFAIPEDWIAGVLQAESGGRTTLNGRPITSPAGAMGLMQVMPATYADLRRRYGFGADPYAVRDNIFAGAAYLRGLYERYGYPYLFAAYNAGPHRFDEFLLRGKPLPKATTAYVNAIVPESSTLFGAGSRVLTAAVPHVGNTLFVKRTTMTEVLSSELGAAAPEAKSALVIAPESTGARYDLFVPLSHPSP